MADIVVARAHPRGQRPFTMIKYLGSKRRLIPRITGLIAALAPPPATVLDLFSGTSRVGHALKRLGYRVIANDHNAYAHTLAACYVQADAPDVLPDAARIIDELNALPGSPGYFTQTFCEQSRYIHPRNGERIDAIRERIAQLALPPELDAVVLTALLEAADRVDSTTGVQMAYLKAWAPRAHATLRLRVPDVLHRPLAGKGEACRLDALDAARLHAAESIDVVYLDPPYNQHSYLGNYHVWESLVRWDKPAHYGVACKRCDVRERKSPFNRRDTAHAALGAVLDALNARALVMSFSDDGFIGRDDANAMLARRFEHVDCEGVDSPRYIGARIGIYNPRGERVGTPGRLRNTEYLFCATAAAHPSRSDCAMLIS